MTIKSFPVAELQTTNYSERFKRWAQGFGIFRLARSLNVDFRTVRRWFDTSRRPEIDKAKAIIALSTVEPLDGNPLTYEDIYGAALASKIEVRHVRKVQAWE